MSTPATASPIQFTATLDSIDEWTILRLPQDASESLRSRGQIAANATLNGHTFQVILEPDGASGHWMRLGADVQQLTGVHAGDTVTVVLEPRTDWPEPHLPDDFASALAASPQSIQDLWNDITPMARWEWVRWINATRNPDTRRRRVEVSISKMHNGKRRPCCFNLAACTDPHLSKNGKLIDPE